jgi:hypothetical protein
VSANPLGSGRTVAEERTAAETATERSDAASRRVLIDEAKRRHLDYARAEGEAIRKAWREGEGT